MRHIYEKHHPWILLCILVIAICSCKKNDILLNQDKQNSLTTQPLRQSNVLPDDPNRVAKVPLIISSGYFSQQNFKVEAQGKGNGKGSTGSSTDATPPTVTITSPANGANVSGTVNVTVNATDNVGVTSVAYTVDDNSIGTSTTAPFSISWNTGSLADGSHTLKATAYDAAGNYSYASISVYKNTTVVQPPPPPPSSTAVELQMPPVQDQGNESSCVAFSVGYSTRSAEYFYRNGASTYTYATNIFSPEFLYNQVKFSSDCGSGTSMQAALDFVVSNGICTWQSMPYSNTNGCSLMPTTAQSAEAANYKIAGYSKIINNDITAIKSMIQQKHPLIVTVVFDDSFINAKTGFIWRSNSGTGSLPHCITIVGYDDSKNAYKVMNSWGTGWGDAGYSWIDYDFFPSVASYYVYVIN